uniref:NADH-ubiquinone oxidoreductase chain 4 n=1 Tax=Trichuris sp. GHL-2013 TaxID=1305677 RepID=S4U3X3_9BILA|nr:NADH dehydrogenase subunit 4 [Trichuris sp. GHL-2013]
MGCPCFSVVSVMWLICGYVGNISSMISLSDCLAYTMILLTVWLFIVYSIYMVKEMKLYQNMVLMYFPLLVIFFSSDNIFMFYIMFEMSILPIFLIIMGWGNQPERLMASNYLLMYTLLFSFPLMIVILSTMNLFNSFSRHNLEVDFIVWFFLMLPFFIKIPIYLFHLWLPKAHVEAPVLGSMVLASILLKVGGYGMLKMFHLYEVAVNKATVGLSLILIFSSSVLCLMQTDLKKFVAYSSVTHMTMLLTLMMAELMTFENSSIFLMVSHGAASNSLFFLVGMLSFASMSRLLYSQNNVMAMNSTLWYSSAMILFLNSGSPPSIAMVSEITLFINSHSIWLWNFIICLGVYLFLLFYPIWMMCSLNSNKTNMGGTMYMPLSDLFMLMYLPLVVLILWNNMPLAL